MEIKFLDDRITEFHPSKDGDVGYDLKACNLAGYGGFGSTGRG